MKKKIHWQRILKQYDDKPACGFVNAYYFSDQKIKVTCFRCLKLIQNSALKIESETSDIATDYFLVKENA